MYGKALALYADSFPYHEQRETVSQTAILNDADYHFCLVYDKDVFVGLLLYWETEDFIYAEHFCILPELRNKHYGQKTLELLKHKGKKVVLEIDPPIDVISNRRRDFYARNGFAVNPYRHIHPPYHIENEGHHLVIMSFPSEITAEEYDSFCRYLECRVMRNA